MEEKYPKYRTDVIIESEKNYEIVQNNYLTFLYMLYKKELKPLHDINQSQNELKTIKENALKAYREDYIFHSLYNKNLELAKELIKYENLIKE